MLIIVLVLLNLKNHLLMELFENIEITVNHKRLFFEALKNGRLNLGERLVLKSYDYFKIVFLIFFILEFSDQFRIFLMFEIYRKLS